MEFSLFVSTLALIFVAELPDKTTFATSCLAARHNPLIGSLGAIGVTQSLVAVGIAKRYKSHLDTARVLYLYPLGASRRPDILGRSRLRSERIV